MSKSFRKRGDEWRRLNDSAMRRTIRSDCRVCLAIVRPGMNSRTITSVSRQSETRPSASSARDMLCVMANQLLALEQGIGAYVSRHPSPEYVHFDPRSGPQSDRQVAVGDVAPHGESVRTAA